MEYEEDAEQSIDEPLTFDVPSESSIRRYGACLECQLRHIKCDGTYPCKACIGRKTKCMFKMKAPKRSSVSSQVEALRQHIKHMTEAINRQMENTKRLQLQYEKVVRDREHSDLKYGQRLAQDTLTLRFADEYRHSAFIFLQMEVPFNDFSYLRRPDADPLMLARMNAVLALGALMIGDHKYPQYYIAEARAALADQFDTLDANVAATHHVLRSACNVTGDYDTELVYSTSALKMSEMLLKKHKTKRIKGVDIGFIYDSSYGNSICQKDFASVKELHDMIRKLPKTKYAWFAAILMQKAASRLMRAIHPLSSELGNIAMVNRILYKLGLVRQLSLHSQFPVSYLLVKHDATRASLFLFIGLDDLAEQNALLVLERVRSSVDNRHRGYNFFFITVSLFVVGQIFAYLQKHEYLEQTIKLLEQFDGADLTITLLRHPATQLEGPSIFSYNYFFPNIEQFRHINLSRVDFPAVRDQLLLDESAITLYSHDHAFNVGFVNGNHAASMVPSMQAEAFVFSEQLLQSPSPPQSFHYATDYNSPSNRPSYNTHDSPSHMSYTYNNVNTPPVAPAKHYYAADLEPQRKRARTALYVPEMTRVNQWPAQYEPSRGTSNQSSCDEDSCGQTAVGSEEEYPSPEQYSVAEPRDAHASLDQVAVMMYFNANSALDTRNQPPNAMYYNQ